ncbi:MAG: exodeoxyribonuclease V subunit alpha [Hydrogenovibrio sp.]
MTAATKTNPLTPDLGLQLAKTLGGNQADFARIVQRLLQALERGDSCVNLTADQIEIVKRQPTVSAGGDQPFVLEGERFYLQRYWQHEVRLAARLNQMAKAVVPLWEQALSPFFNDEHQLAAAKLALTQQLAVITGGPGTGKTTTVVKILTLLRLQNPNVRIALAAPTGKAAMRLTESIHQGKQDVASVRSVFAAHLTALDSVPSEAKTLHRLLGVLPLSPEFRHNASHPLSADVVVVDEASMVDIGTMSRLVTALKPGARLILMGDKDQLASVETGSVLSDISEGLPHNRVHLQTTYRFSGAIKALAEAVNHQDVAAAQAVFLQGDPAVSRTQMDVVEFARRGYQAYQQLAQDPAADLETLFITFAAFQVLCATRRDKARFDHLADESDVWYPGRPVMILENHAELGLFNGDIGITRFADRTADVSVDTFADTSKDTSTDTSTALQVFFPVSEGYKAFMPAQLPAHETAYAMTIHKSQGSEFGHVLIVLPALAEDDTPSQRVDSLLTKELLYTAITRAKQKVTLSATDTGLKAAIQQSVKRNSGLVERLR